MSEDTCTIALQIGTKISLVKKFFFWRKKKTKEKNRSEKYRQKERNLIEYVTLTGRRNKLPSGL